MNGKDLIEIDGKKYGFIPDEIGDGNECQRCAFLAKCNNEGRCICNEQYGIASSKGKRFVEINEKAITEEQAYDDYQERSTSAKDLGEQLAWALIVLLAGMMIGDRCFLEFYVGAACGLAYLLLSMIQSAWQTIAIWIVKQRIKRDNLEIEDYPEWVGGWAWVFWYLKIGLLTFGTIYVVYKFVEPLFVL
jgi:hypothetical protein